MNMLLLRASILFFSISFVAGFVQAKVMDSNITVRTGMLVSSLTGPSSLETSFTVFPIIDFEYLNHQSAKSALIYRAGIAIDSATSVSKYIGFSIGQKHYIGSVGTNSELSSPNDSIKIYSTSKYSFGYNVGLSQVAAESFVSSTFGINSTLIEINGFLGYEHRFSNNYNANAQLDMAYGYGVSSVTFSGILTRFLFGINYSF
ncbi:MAG: hypothetical protein VX642_01875 [Bdellovibrionota bacterium]|nr:hypothetical protein [Bdellovibrionota bacterium]